jgi:hypothetical protein
VTEPATPSAAPRQTCEVFAAEDLFVVHGVAEGEGLARPEDVVPGDVYMLDPSARAHRLVLARGPGGGLELAEGAGLGRPGAAVAVLARYRLMGPQGDGVEVLLLALGGDGLAALPLSPLAARTDYTLVTVEEAPDEVPLSDLLCASFLRGTRITMGDGSQRAIESLRPGDLVLTRDHGRQPLRWLGQATLRAVGAFAPVVIGQGVLGNAGDLAVGPHHRIFLYLRDRALGLPTPEILVQAKHLVDGDTVWRREGGFADYFSLAFDRHEIVYAEGIPAESLLVSAATVTRLPPELGEDLRGRFPGLSHSQHFGTEAGAAEAAEVARRAVRRPRKL